MTDAGDTGVDRSDPSALGWSRRRAGRGFSYRDEQGRRLPDRDAQRCRDLAIPPAWTDVWICPSARGHIQAVGTDTAGRRQYLYHPVWREQRDREKYDRVLRFARSLPEARRRVLDHLSRPGMPQQRAHAVGFRIMDLGAVRVGGEEYAGDEGSFGVATLRREHVSTRGGRVRLRFPGKSGREHDVLIDDELLTAAVRALLARRAGGPELLAWKDTSGRWSDVTSGDINDYVREVTGQDASAKDFRTWHATARAVAVLATEESAAAATSDSRRRRAVAAAMRVVAEHLGNTPAVARSSYVDPRVVDLYLDGDLVADEPPPPAPAELTQWERVALQLLT